MSAAMIAAAETNRKTRAGERQVGEAGLRRRLRGVASV